MKTTVITGLAALAALFTLSSAAGRGRNAHSSSWPGRRRNAARVRQARTTCDRVSPEAHGCEGRHNGFPRAGDRHAGVPQHGYRQEWRRCMSFLCRPWPLSTRWTCTSATGMCAATSNVVRRPAPSMRRRAMRAKWRRCSTRNVRTSSRSTWPTSGPMTRCVS